MRQGDLFENYERERVSETPDLTWIRGQLNGALQELREADSFPWSEQDLGVWRNIFRQMPNWLPEQERTDIQQAFRQALDRWGRA